MSPIWILLAGLATVIGGILWLRLHAFLSLVLGAFVVGLLTPASAVLRYHLDAAQVELIELADGVAVVAGTDDGPFVGVDAAGVTTSRFVMGTRREVDGREVVPLTRQSVGKAPDDEIVVRLSDLRAARKAAATSIFGRLTSGLGTTCGKIGLLIAFASIIGYCLQASGAAARIVTSMLRVTGERFAPLGFMLSGFLLGIPVFFDTVFYLMIPLGQALHRKTGRSYLMYVLSIVAGATMAHSLVPPTPGPLFVAEELGVDMGLMMVGGTIVGLATLLVGFVWARFISARAELALPPDAADVPESTDQPQPSLLASLLPIVIPVVLIAMPLTLKALGVSAGDSADQVLRTLGDRNIALAIAACVAIVLARKYRSPDQGGLYESMEKALAGAGIIILITSAGGAFGGMLRSSGLSLEGLVGDSASAMTLVTLAFVATTVIRTAQGSATVAMMTAVGIFGPIAAAGDLGFHPIYLALAIGAGSKPIAWMNDSGFWVITRMSGMNESQGLKYVTPMTALMGLAGLALLLIGVTVAPNPV